MPGLFAAACLVAAPAHGQSNLDAGKSPAQIFSNTCNACHRSPRELKPTGAAFLREHYATGSREAAAMAAYLASVGSDPRAIQQRRAPVLGAGQAALPEGRVHGSGSDQAKPALASTSKPRRPSDSVEAGAFPVAAGPDSEPEGATAQPAPPERFPFESFEE
jgi:hypothetical protein